MSSIINASISSNGIVSTADASGILLCQSNGKNTNALAWVQFTGASGGATINAFYNVSSVTRNATGNYTVTFTTSMSSINYSATGCCGNSGTNTAIFQGYQGTPTTTTFQFFTTGSSFTGIDFTYNSAIFFA
jgi:hypothetical protein